MSGSGRQRHVILDESVISKAKTWMGVRRIPATSLGLRQIEAYILELKQQLECGYWTHPLDVHEIKDGIVRANSAHDYLYCVLNKDYSHYNEDGSTRDDDEHTGTAGYDYTSFDQITL